jgi:hypothetical protein
MSSRPKTRISHMPGPSVREACGEGSLLSRQVQPVSGDEAAEGDEGSAPASYIRMSASETFDGQERVFSRAAYNLQCEATGHSARCGHPGFVPDDYLEHLNGLGVETTIAAAELCAVGTWERVDGGYRVLDWEAVEVCLDHVARPGARTRRPSPGTGIARPRPGPR